MINDIYEIKNKIVRRIEDDIQQNGMERIDVKEMGELVDMVKDLAEAEASCMQAEYYKSVTKSMNSAGYDNYGYNSYYSRMGYGRDSNNPMNRRSGYYDSMGHNDIISPLRMAMQNADPEERSRLVKDIRLELGL